MDPARQRRGIGRALYASLFEGMRIQRFSSAIAVIALPNPASVMLHESAGFERVGVFRHAGYKLGRWHDVGWWQLQLQAQNPNPIAPRSFAELVETSQWARALQAGLAID